MSLSVASSNVNEVRTSDRMYDGSRGKHGSNLLLTLEHFVPILQHVFKDRVKILI